MAYSKKVIDTFSEQVEKVKLQNNFDSLIETLEFIIEEKYYDFVTWSNAGQFLNKNLKGKLQIEYSQKNMMKDKYKKGADNTLF